MKIHPARGFMIAPNGTAAEPIDPLEGPSGPWPVQRIVDKDGTAVAYQKHHHRLPSGEVVAIHIRSGASLHGTLAGLDEPIV
jgi:hypothetical protein